MPTSTSRVIWRNWHETVIQPVIQYENLRNANETQSTVGGYNQTARAIQGHIQSALEQESSLRAAGGGWSFAPVAATDGILLGTQRLNYRFALRQEHLTRPYPPGELPVLLQCGISIADVNAYLAGRDQALRTSGASNGQTIAGALGTGTHGAALDIGAVQDYVVGIHLAISPSETIWLERKDYPVLRPEVMEQFRARPFLDNDVFDAALVSFGSFGIVLGVVIEPDPFVSTAAPLAVRRVLAVPRRLGQNRRAQRRDTQPIRLERADIPTRHACQRESQLTIGSGDGVVVELVWSQSHDPKTSTAVTLDRGPVHRRHA